MPTADAMRRRKLNPMRPPRRFGARNVHVSRHFQRRPMALAIEWTRHERPNNRLELTRSARAVTAALAAQAGVLRTIEG